MKKVINGALYDTETATCLCDISGPTFSRSDFQWQDSSLYRSPKGQFFIAGEGGARTRWAKPVENGSTGGSGLELVDENEARQLIEQHGSAELFTQVFGEPVIG